MDDARGVHVVQSVQQLRHEVLELVIRERLRAAKNAAEVRLHDLKLHVQIAEVGVLGRVDELQLDDIIMGEEP